MSIEMLQSQIDYLKQEIDYLKEQIRELREAAEKRKPAGPELPWDKAPEWALWAAMDENTNWYWHSQEPHTERGAEWISYHSVQDFSFFPCTNWKESKRKRP